jgi:hypothetical protein
MKLASLHLILINLGLRKKDLVEGALLPLFHLLCHWAKVLSVPSRLFFQGLMRRNFPSHTKPMAGSGYMNLEGASSGDV